MFAKGTVWQNSAFFFGKVPFSPPPFAPLSPLSGLWKGYMKRHVGWWKWSFYIERVRDGDGANKIRMVTIYQRTRICRPHGGTKCNLAFQGLDKKKLNDADSCPRFRLDLGSKVNAESKSFPEALRVTLISLNDWMSMFPPNIDHIQHLNLPQPTETVPKAKVQYEHISTSIAYTPTA